jgi:hypothetical protein
MTKQQGKIALENAKVEKTSVEGRPLYVIFVCPEITFV